jgi:hypothetical protein
MQLAGLLAAPLAWIGLAYLGSLAVLLLNAFWVQDSFSGRVIPSFTLASFERLFTVEIYRTIAVRTTPTPPGTPPTPKPAASPSRQASCTRGTGAYDLLPLARCAATFGRTSSATSLSCR